MAGRRGWLYATILWKKRVLQSRPWSKGKTMQPRPLTKFEEFTNTRRAIEDGLCNSYVVDEMSIERLKRSVLSESRRNDITDAYRAALFHELAYVLVFQGRYSESMDKLRTALNLGFDKIAYALSSSHLSLLHGEVLRAREFITLLEGVELAPDTEEMMAAHLIQAGAVGKLSELIPSVEMELSPPTEALNILRRLGVDDLELTRRLDTACRVIRANVCHPILAYRFFALEGEGILYSFVVKDSLDKLAELNDKILDALIDEHDGPLDRELSIRVTPWHEGLMFSREEVYSVGIS